MLTAIVFIIILGLLIFVHELGHFLVAIKNGIRADEFGFGFPPRIFGVQPLKKKRNEKGDGIEIQDAAVKTRWRFIWGKRNTDKELKKDSGMEEGTIYSVNWIPLGGFVKIKGEDGSHGGEKDSFASKSAWVRIKVLFAGVAMNFLLAWFLISIALMMGSPEAVEDGNKMIRDAKIQISQVLPEAPAEQMGIKPGDEIIQCVGQDEMCQNKFSDIVGVQNYIGGNKGNEITLLVRRGGEELVLKGVPRIEYPANEGALGISLVKTAIVRYPWHEAIIKGFTTTIEIIVLIFTTLYDILRSIFVGEKVAVDVSGPVGIAYLTKQVTQLGFVYILQFAALLSINLGIINGLPLPALDGGRILFVILEKIKGSPVSQKVEQIVHTAGFVLLILLMIVVTLRDILKFEIVEKIGNYF